MYTRIKLVKIYVHIYILCKYVILQMTPMVSEMKNNFLFNYYITYVYCILVCVSVVRDLSEHDSHAIAKIQRN